MDLGDHEYDPCGEGTWLGLPPDVIAVDTEIRACHHLPSPKAIWGWMGPGPRIWAEWRHCSPLGLRHHGASPPPGKGELEAVVWWTEGWLCGSPQGDLLHLRGRRKSRDSNRETRGGARLLCVLTLPPPAQDPPSPDHQLFSLQQKARPREKSV